MLLTVSQYLTSLWCLLGKWEFGDKALKLADVQLLNNTFQNNGNQYRLAQLNQMFYEQTRLSRCGFSNKTQMSNAAGAAATPRQTAQGEERERVRET